jgi:1-acyl-sn-glycerol-3-phosphate acyltransferase
VADLVQRAVVRLTRAVHRAIALRFDVQDEQPFPATGAAVLAINHMGYLDFTGPADGTQRTGR